MLAPWMNPADLAPGDAKSPARDWAGFELHRIRSEADPYFAQAFDALWTEFGPRHEMESAEVIARRLRWDPAVPQNGCALFYELLLITKAGEFVGVRDHAVIVRPGFDLAVVHLSHNLVAPAFRRSGIAAWLRALPATAARRLTPQLPIALVAEMEPADPLDEARTIRLTAYERAAYRKIDPLAVSYLQPDFRDPAEIDATGGPRPLSLSLLVRFVGDESRRAMSGAEVRGIVENLYRMYAVEFRAQDMAAVQETLAGLPADNQEVALLPPTIP